MRLPYYASSTAQVNRNTWGSVEEFFAAFVANVPTLFTLRKDPNKEREEESTSSARARPRFTPNQFHDTDLFETNVQLGTVTAVEGDIGVGVEKEGERGRTRGRSRGNSRLNGQASEENLIPDGMFTGGGGDYRGRGR